MPGKSPTPKQPRKEVGSHLSTVGLEVGVAYIPGASKLQTQNPHLVGLENCSFWLLASLATYRGLSNETLLTSCSILEPLLLKNLYYEQDISCLRRLRAAPTPTTFFFCLLPHQPWLYGCSQSSTTTTRQRLLQRLLLVPYKCDTSDPRHGFQPPNKGIAPTITGFRHSRRHRSGCFHFAVFQPLVPSSSPGDVLSHVAWLPR